MPTSRVHAVEEAVGVFVVAIIIAVFAFLAGYDMGSQFPCKKNEVLVYSEECVSDTEQVYVLEDK